MSDKQIQLDGRTLEGGGQLLRLAIGLAALKAIPVKITDIRANRSRGGLSSQHLAGVEWLARASNAKTHGVGKGSTTLDFRPGCVGPVSPIYRLITVNNDDSQYWECRFNIRTAGSTGLGLQAILPFLLFHPPMNDDDGTPSDLPIRLRLTGGTNVSGSPSYEYLTQVLFPTLHNIGLPLLSGTLGQRGWSQGGNSIGNFTLEIPARHTLDLPAFSLYPTIPTAQPNLPDRLDVTFVGPVAAHAHLCNNIVPAIANYFGPKYSPMSHNITVTCEDSGHDKRYYLIIVATVPSSHVVEPISDTTPANVAIPTTYKLGRDWLYDQKITQPEQVASTMADRVSRDIWHEWTSGAYVDEHMRDQLVVFQALASGESLVFGGRTPLGELREPSLHTRTAEWVVERMMGEG